MGDDHFCEAPLSVPEHFDLELAGVDASMPAPSSPSDFCVPSPDSKGSHASDASGFPWSLDTAFVKQEQQIVSL